LRINQVRVHLKVRFGDKSMAEVAKNLSGLTDAQAKEFHEHWKHGTWSWVMIACAVHVVTWVYQPWF
jgi:light-harvesting complex 1 beta chain